MSTMPSSDQVEAWVEDQLKSLRLAEPLHSHGDGPLTHLLEVSRRNGTPHVPKHCAGDGCVSGFGHSEKVCHV